MKTRAWGLLAILMLLVFPLGNLSAQNPSPKPGPAAPATPAPAAVDETKMKISDTPAPQPGAQAQNSSDVNLWSFLGMLLMLGAVIALIYGFIFFLKKLSGQQTSAPGTLKVLQIQVLNGNRALYLVEVAGEVLLVGTGDAGVRLIKEITEKETLDTIRLAQGTTPGVKKSSFSEVLQKLLGRKAPVQAPPVEETLGEGADFLKKQQDRLKNL